MIPVLVYDRGQCDPRKCTAKRMERFGLAREVPLNRIPPGALVLTPSAERALSPADSKYARHGLVVMDLTWAHIGEMPEVRGSRPRRLPYLLAANPVNFGKPWNLNSAEAVLASLVIMGMDEQAELFVPRFNWAPTFLTMNRSLLDGYRAAPSSEEVQRLSDEYVESITGDRGQFRAPGRRGAAIRKPKDDRHPPQTVRGRPGP